MTRQDATELAMKFAATWHGGPKPEIWAEELEELHTNQALETYRRLRRSEDKAPSVRQFLDTYNALTLPDDTPKAECQRCDGSGWAEQLPVVHHRQCAGGNECHCSAVHPCHCAEGRARQATFTRITGGRDAA